MTALPLSASVLLRQHYVELFPAEATDVLQALSNEQLLVEIQDLPVDSLIEVIDYFSPSRATYVYSCLAFEIRRDILLKAPTRVLLKVLLTMSDEEKSSVLTNLPRHTQKEIETILAFPVDSVANIMSSAVGTINVDMTVDEAIEQIRVEAKAVDLSQLVVDENNRLLGKVTTHSLSLAQGSTPIRDLIENIPCVINVVESREAVVEMMETVDFDLLPVLDDEQKLLGVVRSDILQDVVQEDAQADLQRMMGVSTDERALSRGLLSIKHRLPWLYVNLGTAFLAAAVVGVFENIVAQFTALAVLLPVVAGQSGNAGSQAMAVTIRGLALREISFRQWFRLSRKELFVGILNGLLIAVVCGIAVFLWQQSLGLSLIISMSMVIALAIAGIAGALVPILLARFGQDPATASSIILTTITDVVGFFVFLGIATLMASMI